MIDKDLEKIGLERHILFNTEILCLPYEDGDGPSKHPVVEPDHTPNWVKFFRIEEGRKCKNAILHVCHFLCAVFAVFVAFLLAISVAVVLFTAWFPQFIKYFPKVSRPPEPTNPTYMLSPWGRPVYEPCDLFRMDLMWNDCGEKMNWCREEVKKYKDGEEEEERFWNITRTCFEAAECLEFLACPQADQELQTFGRLPHEFFMTNNQFPICMMNFYQSIKDDTYDNCTADFDYLSKSYQIKNRAYIDGKDCFMAYVWENCHESVFDYLVRSYNAFLNLATVPSDSCGAFQRIEALECRESAEVFKVSVNNLTLAGSSKEEFKRVAMECDHMQYCYSQLYDFCIAKPRFLQETKEYCNKMHFLATPLIQCLQKLKKDKYQPNLREYPCFIGHDFNEDATACIRFRDSTSCVKRIMKDYCGEDVLEGFDDANSYLLEMWDC